MPSPIGSTLTAIFITSILLLFSTSDATSSSTLINKVCSNGFFIESCVRVLESEPRVTLATNLFDLTVGIIKSGISRSTHTRRHLRSLLKKNITDPDVKGGLQDCKGSYDWVIGSMKSGLGEVKEREYMTASYDLLLSATDCIRSCNLAVSSKGIKDKIIVRGNQLVEVFGLSAFEGVELL